MADTPNKYIDNIQIGPVSETNKPAQIAAPYIVTKVDESGAPCEPKFKSYYEVGDFKKVVEIETESKEWVVSLTELDKDTPSITCLDENGDIIFGDVKYEISSTTRKVTIKFNQAVKGKVMVN